MSDEISRLRAELEASEARFRSVIARNADAIVVVDQAGVVLFANPAAEALFGRPAAELVGETFGFPAVAGETTELEVLGRAGRRVAAEMRVVETEWEGRPAYLASLRDVTERRRAEEERAKLAREQAARQEAEAALRMRDEFLAIAAHELRTPLTSIRGYSQLLLRQVDGDEPLDRETLGRQLRLVERESKRLGRLISQLLDLTHIRGGRLELHLEPTDISAIVERVAQAARSASARHELITRLPGPVQAMVDPYRLEHVLLNLVENAIRYSPDGGPIELELEVSGGKTLCISVRDHGLGIPPAARTGLFDRFHQAHRAEHRSGLGIGLYVARQIILLHGGDLEAEFPPDGGTCFLVSLPLEAAGASSPEEGEGRYRSAAE